ncbi:hypothetical protein AB6E88_13190 [Providencia hangzhouensis]
MEPGDLIVADEEGI